MVAAFEKLDAMAAKDDKGNVVASAWTKENVVTAACSVGIDKPSLATIQAYARTAAPTAAEPVVEPERKVAEDVAKLDDATEKQLTETAAETRRVLDRSKKK